MSCHLKIKVQRWQTVHKSDDFKNINGKFIGRKNCGTKRWMRKRNNSSLKRFVMQNPVKSLEKIHIAWISATSYFIWNKISLHNSAEYEF